MRCDEPLFEEGQTYSAYSCRLDLNHSGAHEDARRRKYPRALALGLDEDLNDLITAGHNVNRDLWDLDEREYPVLVEVTQRYVKWVSAPSEDDALKYWDDPTDLNLDSADVIDGDLEVQRIDRHLATEAFRSRHTRQHIGPQIQCPGCGTEAFRREWFHDPFRKCHGPIEWRENANARALQWRYRREFKAAPVASQAVTS
ncbi:hypothetical protein ACFVRD_41280 [Streptomyces sp. NPDC057908]|uniref:hypothetical protein n=1 Tax=Streptomyces sp. NPDC057908 TaxID=3346276 RepID=UPI0036EAC5B9